MDAVEIEDFLRNGYARVVDLTNVRFTGHAIAEDAVQEAVIRAWERKDPLAFDNMQDRAVSGTTDWGKHRVVLDVADGAAAIAFGTLLSGRGDVSIADLRFEPVSTDVPTTGHESGRGYPTRPRNLDFTEE